MTAYDKYSLLNRDNLTQPIRTQLSQKQSPNGPVSKDPLTGNMVNGFKHCCDLDNSTVTIFTDHLEGNWVGISLF